MDAESHAGSPPPEQRELEPAVGSDEQPETDETLAAFTASKEQLRARLEQLRGATREVALAVAARIDADVAVALTALEACELGPKRRRSQVRHLERLLDRSEGIVAEPTRGRRRDLKRLAQAVHRIVLGLADPGD